MKYILYLIYNLLFYSKYVNFYKFPNKPSKFNYTGIKSKNKACEEMVQKLTFLN